MVLRAFRGRFEETTHSFSVGFKFYNSLCGGAGVKSLAVFIARHCGLVCVVCQDGGGTKGEMRISDF